MLRTLIVNMRIENKELNNKIDNLSNKYKNNEKLNDTVLSINS